MTACASPSMLGLPADAAIEVLRYLEDERPVLRLVCKRFRQLVDCALSPSLTLHLASHLGGKLSQSAVYSSQEEFTVAASRMLKQRAGGLRRLELDFDAYGAAFACQLLIQQALPQLRCVALENVEPGQLGMLRALPRLDDVALSRHINGPVTADQLVQQLAGLPLRRLCLRSYRMEPGLVAHIAEVLPCLRQLELLVESVDHPQGRLELAGLASLRQLESLELHLPATRSRGPAAVAPEEQAVCVSPLPAGATDLCQLTRLVLAHVRPEQGPGQKEALWTSVAQLPAVQHLRFEADGRTTRQPPAALLQMTSLTSLHIKLDGKLCQDDAPDSLTTKAPELPLGALPNLTTLHLDCVGLAGLPASWCTRPLQELHVSAMACEHTFYSLQLPSQLVQLAGSLRRLELPSCCLMAVPDVVSKLTGLTYLGLPHNSIVSLPNLSSLKRLAELDVVGSPAMNATNALQQCKALRRLGIGVRRYASALVAGNTAAYEDVEACRWQEAWLQTVRTSLPWVSEVGVFTAQRGHAHDGSDKK